MTASGPKFDLPGSLADKVASFPESSYGVSFGDTSAEQREAYTTRPRRMGASSHQGNSGDDIELSKLDPLKIVDVLSEP